MRNRYNHVRRHRLNSSRRGRRNLNCASGVVRLPDGSVANLSSRNSEDAIYDIVEICREYVNNDFADYLEEYLLDKSSAGVDESIVNAITRSVANDVLDYRLALEECESYLDNHVTDKTNPDYELAANLIKTALSNGKTDYDYEDWKETFAQSALNSSVSNARPIEEFVHDWFISDTMDPNHAEFENICDIVYKYARNYLTEDCFEDETEMVRVMRRIPYDVRAMIMQKADKYLISDDIYFQ